MEPIGYLGIIGILVLFFVFWYLCDLWTTGIVSSDLSNEEPPKVIKPESGEELFNYKYKHVTNPEVTVPVAPVAPSEHQETMLLLEEAKPTVAEKKARKPRTTKTGNVVTKKKTVAKKKK